MGCYIGFKAWRVWTYKHYLNQLGLVQLILPPCFEYLFPLVVLGIKGYWTALQASGEQLSVIYKPGDDLNSGNGSRLP